ncbi:MAG: hypothetical protein D8M52_01075 [Chlorobi bacterium]|nr:MAG: hypothetical protein F9K28_00175 [Bacteroidota bacterium]MBE2265240.1 hypothetical protein [Flavobacteriales bacterium]MBL1160297.1 hypothetical protein [Chlorobiota bacterium]MBW7853436.1 hypothetical protein [Candidatus Kapabacteria bacterium]MCC6330482.1 hypothetical protein [Ignavibacteria bacterium]
MEKITIKSNSGMTNDELIALCRASLQEHSHIRLTAEVFASLSSQQVSLLTNTFGAKELLHLPDYEVDFFNWLQTADPNVWADLWDSDSATPYLVSMAFLESFSGTGQGVFHICDLQSTDNYYFAPEMFVERESDAYKSAVHDMVLSGKPLTIAQLLTAEASAGPVDIWHFAYRRGINLEAAKRAVSELVNDRVLVHVTSADHLTGLFNVE